MSTEFQLSDIKNIEVKDIEDYVSVYTGDCYSIYSGKYGGESITIKLLGHDKNDIKKIIKEINMLRCFKYAPNVIRLLGYIYDDSLPYGIVVEDICLTLREYLDNNKNLSYYVKASIMLDAVKGLEALHTKDGTPILHKNLTSDSFYMTKNNILKIGIGSRYKPSNKVNFMAYFDYNILTDIFSEYTIISEIYSLGVVLWEILTGKIPFENMDYTSIYNMLIKDNVSEPLPLDAPLELQSIITACRHKEYSRRPNTTSMRIFLHQYTINI
ncbi:SWPV2-ORF260 [Shearwaterpox virus]|uniref:SWPV2-ORF260 n=2 Tax=Avipoxvirus TaxID=10260 RepID=A0A1V0QGL5_CNPV|nr:SWPV2-ORF260 [Shearwaterpox virus]QRI42992.1 putative tyrosine protein kinase [Cheloniid poxvirus 1]QRM15553.1 putative tyrosine protein kinase [Mudlarkpox virus]QRM15906.1 putative tyrosine protein kinase [Penguinpox virus 2]QRM16243.1 putative tyrosine protein kinase [Albatrosspox virus]